MEERHLQQADSHIAQAHEHIRRLESLIEARRGEEDVEQAIRTLATMQELLAAFIAHRQLLAQNIKDIDAGKL